MTSLEHLSPSEVAALAVRLEDAVTSHDKARLEQLQAELSQAVGRSLRSAPKSVVDAVRRAAPSEAPESRAFALGQLAFAESFVAQVSERRAENKFTDLMFSPRYRKYMEQLSRSEKRNQELIASCGEDQATVSRKLRDLRTLGICDFRKEGVNTINFLTPAARAVYLCNTSVVSAPLVLDVFYREKLSSIGVEFHTQKVFVNDGAGTLSYV